MQPNRRNPVRFNLSESVPLPMSVVHHEIDGRDLWLAPKIPSWLVTHSIASALLSGLLDGATLRDAVLAVGGAHGLSSQNILKHVQELLTLIEKRRFYHHWEGEADYVAARDLRPDMIHMYLTHRCNFSCFHCYMNAGQALQDELDTRTWTHFLHDASEVFGPATLTFSGGEPLLHPDCLILAEKARGLGHTALLMTNGSLVKDAHTARRIVDLFARIQVSVDGPDAESFERIRGTGTYAKTILGIQRLYQAGGRLELAVQVLPDNIDALEARLLLWLQQFDVGRFDVFLSPQLDRIGRACELDDQYFQYPDEMRARVTGLLRQLDDAGIFTARPDPPVPKRKTGCGIGLGFAIDSNGTIFPCPKPYHPLGKYPEENLTRVAECLAELRAVCSLEHLEECQTCDLRYLCGGGCRLDQHARTGEFGGAGCTPEFRQGLLHALVSSPS